MEPNDCRPRDRVLRAAVLNGDQCAWQTWYDETFDDLYRYVHWRCGGKTDWANELVQETWLTAVRRVRHFNPEQASFLAWLRGIAANLLRNHLRRRATLKRRERPIDGSEPAATRDSRQAAEAKSLRIAAALASLSERHEAVLRAKYLECRPVADVALAWNETPKAVESLLHRARQCFREAYERLEREENEGE